MSVGVLLAVGGVLDAPLMRALHPHRAIVSVQRRCGDATELLAAAAAGLGAIAVLDTTPGDADASTVRSLRSSGIRVLLLAHPDDVSRISTLGADAVLRIDDDPTIIAKRIADLATVPLSQGMPDGGASPPQAPTICGDDGARDGASRNVGTVGNDDASRRVPPRPRNPRGRAEAGAEARVGGTEGEGPDAAALAGPPPPPPPRTRRERRHASPAPTPAPLAGGGVVALWGPPGSHGRSTVAVALAQAFGTCGPTLLIDADVVAPSLAIRLAILDDVSGLATLSRRANQGRLDHTALTSATVSSHSFDVITGLGSATRWRELSPAAVAPILETARRHYTYVVLDLDSVPWPEDTDGTFGHQPGQARSELLKAADLRLHIASTDTDSIHRLMIHVEEHPLEHRDLLVVTRVRASATGSRPRAAILEALARFSHASSVILIPEDRRSVDAALLAGSPLTLHQPASPASRALWDLAYDLVGQTASRRERAQR
ncbi:MAG: hypothetical protein Q4P36_04505 [Bowdeniella nasicola]|nr:hypothetical protein [Bowdeniella nasicola]